MKVNVKITGIMVVLLGATTVFPGVASSQATSEYRIEFEKALILEEVEVNLEEAIDLYRKIVDETGDRELAAKAQFHIGLCHERLGQVEARTAYEQILKFHADQQEWVEAARARLALIPQPEIVSPAADIVVKRVAGIGDTLGSPSPDGRLVSGVDWSTGELAVFDVSTGQHRLLTDKGAWDNPNENALSSIFSPDGKQIAYVWANYGSKDTFYDLRIVGIQQGSKPRILYRDESVESIVANDWSPDGKHVLVGLSKEDRTHQLALISVDSGSVRAIKSFEHWQFPANARLSPDGRSTAYDAPPSASSKQNDIFLIGLDGREELTLVEHPANEKLLGWTPDGRQVLFSSDRTGTRDAYLLDVSSAGRVADPLLIKKDIGDINPMRFDQQGSFYYGTVARTSDIYTVEIDSETGRPRGTPQKISLQFEGRNFEPHWSLDGMTLVFETLHIGGDFRSPLSSWSLFLHSLESGEQTQIELEVSNLFSAFMRPKLSPDGRSVLLVGRDDRGRQGVYKVDYKTGATSPLVYDDILLADWYPDGNAIVYVVGDRIYHKKMRVFKHDLATGRNSEILTHDSFFRGMAVSPDGRFLAVCTPRRLEILSLEGGEHRVVFRNPKELSALNRVTWTPDGRGLIFSHGGGRYNSLRQIALEGGQPRNIGPEMLRIGTRGLSLHPNGELLAFHAHSGQTKSEVWVLENLLSRSK